MYNIEKGVACDGLALPGTGYPVYLMLVIFKLHDMINVLGSVATSIHITYNIFHPMKYVCISSFAVVCVS